MKISIGEPLPYGASVQSSGVNFAIASNPATAVSLCLFSFENQELIDEIPLDPEKNKTGGVWHIFIEGLELPLLYGWRIDGPKGPNRRYHFDPDIILADPYSPALYSPAPWGAEEKQPFLSAAFSSEPFDWEDDVPLHIPAENSIIYEMHVRAFTQDVSSGVNYPGTYRGLIEKIPYLVELGVNAVELMPVYAFDEHKNFFSDPKTGKPLPNFWGYSPLSFFAPMPRYSSDLSPDGVIREFKEMVKALHKAGIEVILDVVYNHTGEGGYDDAAFSMKGIDFAAYYMLDANNQPIDFTGCGNTVFCNQPISIEMIIKSLRYWVTEMHVDGFRFDLASVLNRGKYGRPLGTSPIIEAMSLDPVLRSTKLIAEPWDAGGLYQVGGFHPQDSRWSEWNGKYRDGVRKFINNLGTSKGEFATRLSGSQDLYGHGRSPTCSLNFVTAHDGFTLNDLVSYTQKHNEANGEENRDGSNDNDSGNYGVEGPTDDKKILALRRRQMKNFIVTLFFSQGVPMLLMGDEYGHTKDGNNNTYSQDNRLNWFLWNELEKNQDFFRFVKGIIHLRKTEPMLRRTTFLTEEDISWHGLKPMYQEWDNSDPVLAFTLYDHEKSQHLYVAYNLRGEEVEIEIPEPPEGLVWHVLVDTALESPFDCIDEAHSPPHQSTHFELDNHSVIVLKALPLHSIHYRLRDLVLS